MAHRAEALHAHWVRRTLSFCHQVTVPQTLCCARGRQDPLTDHGLLPAPPPQGPPGLPREQAWKGPAQTPRNPQSLPPHAALKMPGRRLVRARRLGGLLGGGGRGEAQRQEVRRVAGEVMGGVHRPVSFHSAHTTSSTRGAAHTAGHAHCSTWRPLLTRWHTRTLTVPILSIARHRHTCSRPSALIHRQPLALCPPLPSPSPQPSPRSGPGTDCSAPLTPVPTRDPQRPGARIRERCRTAHMCHVPTRVPSKVWT